MGPNGKGGFFKPVDPMELQLKAEVMCENKVHDASLAKPVASWRIIGKCPQCDKKVPGHVCNMCRENISTNIAAGNPMRCTKHSDACLIEWSPL